MYSSLSSIDFNLSLRQILNNRPSFQGLMHWRVINKHIYFCFKNISIGVYSDMLRYMVMLSYILVYLLYCLYFSYSLKVQVVVLSCKIVINIYLYYKNIFILGILVLLIKLLEYAWAFILSHSLQHANVWFRWDRISANLHKWADFFITKGVFFFLLLQNTLHFHISL